MPGWLFPAWQVRIVPENQQRPQYGGTDEQTRHIAFLEAAGKNLAAVDCGGYRTLDAQWESPQHTLSLPAVLTTPPSHLAVGAAGCL